MGQVDHRIDFLAENNACGQTLLKLVSRGNAIIAELLRLADFVPSVFLHPQGIHTELLMDFGYFKISDSFDSKLENNIQLQEADEELRENYLGIITRFYQAFESIRSYVGDLNRYVEDLEDGAFIQQSLESVFLNTEGKQLLTESLYLYGVMLLIMDSKLDGGIRERLLVAYYRYSAQRSSLHSDLDEVCTLLRGTGYTKGGKRPSNYPENYFSRVALNKNFVSMVIGRLRSDDLYNQINAFPLPEHRSAALGTQAGMLYVCLYFSPGILHQQMSTMREIVDKYFPDNWIISIYMGMTVNLAEAWEPYKAARSALATTLDWENVKAIAYKHGQELEKLNVGLKQFLSEGTLTKEFILDNTNKLLNALRRCNVTLRWLMLHTTTPLRSDWEISKRSRQLRELVVAESKFKTPWMFYLLLSTSQFELKLKEKFREMLRNKLDRCLALRRDVVDRLDELVEVFSGAKPLVRVEKNEKLQAWFADLKVQVDQLEFANSPSVTGRKLVQLIRALEEVQEFHSLDAHLGVRQFLQDMRDLMHQLLRTLNIKEDTLVQIQLISDLSYAWEIIDKYTPHMQEGIKTDPSLAIKLRATFLKLASALDLPLLRIQEAGSPDLVSVSQFYSRELVLYVRRVLQVIPETLFSLLAKIVSLQTKKIQELPTKLDKEKMREYARLDDRYEVARLTHAISVLTEGVLMMKTTLVGIIKIDPKQLLEDGVRKELVRQVATALHQTLVFNQKIKHSELIARLTSLASQMDGTRRSFVYISDYISLCGLKIWQEEFSRIICYNLEQECNSFLKHQVQDYESVYQSKVIPIPKFPPIDGVSNNFFGRLAREIMKETDPKTTIFIHTLSTWYDPKTHAEKLNPQFFKLIMSAVSNTGLSGLDRLCCFMILSSLEQILKDYNKKFLNTKDLFEFLQTSVSMFTPNARLFDQPSKVYLSLLQKPAKLLSPFVDLVAKLGQLQILRLQFLREITNAAKFESKLLEEALQTLNLSLISEIKAHFQNPQKVYPKEDNPLMYELTSYLEISGITDPLRKVYVCQRVTVQYFPFFAFLLVLSQIPKLSYIKNVGLLTKKPAEAVDGTPFVIGLVTLMQQFHKSQHVQLLDFIAQYVNSFLTSSLRAGTKRLEVAELAPEMAVMLKFLAEFSHFGGFKDEDVQRVIPENLLNEYHACLNPN